jgi:prephenate dehydratase
VGVPIRVAYSGEVGAFAEDAMLAYFAAPQGVPLPGFRQVFEAVSAGHLAEEAPGAVQIAAGVLPIENVVNGTVREVYDLLLEHDLLITGEVVVPVHLCLAALPGQRLEDIERVYSHIQALGQAEAFLRRRPWSLLTTYNTAGAAKLIVERGESGAAAVLSPRAAALFGLEILADPVQDVPDNRTRFIIVSRSDVEPPPALSERPMRTTVVFGTPNQPGSLHRLLGILARAGINMSKLESRPLRGRPWEYVFWVDLDADAADPGTAAALAELREAATLLRVLGSYPRWE